MQFTELITDDDAVSPVIGVILMVAITVILAAVTASFALGLGQQSKKTPDASFSFQYEEVDENDASDARNWGYVKVSHTGGDAINQEDLYIRGSGFNSSGKCDGSFGNRDDWASTPNTAGNQCGLLSIPSPSGKMHHFTDKEIHRSSPGPWPAGQVEVDDSESRVVAGTFARVFVSSEYEMSVVYQREEDQTSATLAEDTGPDA